MNKYVVGGNWQMETGVGVNIFTLQTMYIKVANGVRALMKN